MSKVTKSLALVGLLSTMGCAYPQYVKDNWAASEAGMSREAYRDGKSRGLSVEEMKSDPTWYRAHMVSAPGERWNSPDSLIIWGSCANIEGRLEFNTRSSQWELRADLREELNPYHTFTVARSYTLAGCNGGGTGGAKVAFETLDHDAGCGGSSCWDTHKIAIVLGRADLVRIANLRKGQVWGVILENQAREEVRLIVTPVMAKVALMPDVVARAR